MLEKSRNPLESGQCFLPVPTVAGYKTTVGIVAIPSNRVNVSYMSDSRITGCIICNHCRNPLESGQCFLLYTGSDYPLASLNRSQSPRIGSMFPTSYGGFLPPSLCGRTSQSPRIGSMFPTAPIFFYGL